MKKLLIVDDDPSVLAFTIKVAQSLQYEVVKAKDGIEALLAYSDASDIDALITDIRMPGVDGFQLAASLRDKHPGLPVLFISGYSELLDASDMKSRPGTHFLPKPFSPQQLGSALLLLIFSGT